MCKHKRPHAGLFMGPKESESKASRTRRADTSISSSVVNRPKLKRMEASLCVAVRPKERSTWDGSGMPDAQADPVEAAIRGCKDSRMSCALKPSNQMLALPGWRCPTTEPLTATGKRPPFRR